MRFSSSFNAAFSLAGDHSGSRGTARGTQLPRALFFFHVEDPRMGNPRGGCFARLVAAVLR
jgi:hypothetical protein